MALVATDLVIQAGPLPSTFVGTPQDLFTQMIQRMKIMSPGGTNFIFVGDTAPVSNVGPWLRGEQWWVWDQDTKQYVPLDISASFTIPFFIGNATPASQIPEVWLKTTQDATTSSPTSFGTPISWYFWNGSVWQPWSSIPSSGTTAERPSSPSELQEYYDTDITCLIWWERGTWRTKSGVPGDLKFVAFPALNDALRANPGWNLFGSGNPAYRGRNLIQATQDPGANPVSNFPPINGVPAHAAFDTFGEGSLLKTDNTSTLVYPPTIALWCLVKE